jgi:hypothetical protein
LAGRFGSVGRDLLRRVLCVLAGNGPWSHLSKRGDPDGRCGAFGWCSLPYRIRLRFLVRASTRWRGPRLSAQRTSHYTVALVVGFIVGVVSLLLGFADMIR